MPFEPDYIDKLYSALKNNVEGFTKSPTDFRSSITGDTAYANRVYSALKNNVEGFTLPQPDFNKRLGFDSKEVQQQQQPLNLPDAQQLTQQMIGKGVEGVPQQEVQMPDNGLAGFQTAPLKQAPIQAVAPKPNEKEVWKEPIGGSTAGGIYNDLIGSAASFFGGMVDLAERGEALISGGSPIKITMGGKDYSVRGAVQNIVEEKLRTKSSTREQEQARKEFDVSEGIDASDVEAMALSSPKLLSDLTLGALTSGSSFFAQSINDNAKELEENPNAAKLSEGKKFGYVYIQALVQAGLEKFSVDKMLGSVGVTKKIKEKIAAEITEELLQKGTKATAKEIEEMALKKASSLSETLKRVGGGAVKGGGVESVTEMLQSGASDGIKLLANEVSGQDVFNEEDIKKNFIKNIINSGAQALPMGAIFGGGAASISTPKSDITPTKETVQEPTVEELVTEEIKEPTEEQKFKDVKEGNFTTFTYGSESEVPEIFKDKISSKGTTNGKTEIKVTLPKSEADFYLSQQEKPSEEEIKVPEITPIKTDEGVAKDNEPIASKESSITESEPTETLQPTENKIETDNAVMEGESTDKVSISDVDVLLPEKGFVISDVYLKEGKDKGKGSGQDIYKKALDKHGVLYSFHPISEDALRVQDKLTEKGIANIETIELSDGTSVRKITPKVGQPTQPTKPIETIQEQDFNKMSDADIEGRMNKLEDDKNYGDEFENLEKEMEKRERASVFDKPLNEVGKAVDELMKKEKEQPNGYGSFLDRKDASETKQVAEKYLNPKNITDAKLKKDFKDAVMGNPDTWYADGLKLRESMKEAANRGIDTQELVKEVEKEFVKDGYTSEDAKETVARKLKPIFEGAKKVETGKSKLLQEQPTQEISSSEQPTVSESILGETEKQKVVTEDTKTISKEKGETKEQVTKPAETEKKDIGDKARDLADKIEKGEVDILPSWLQATLPKGTQKLGGSINDAFAAALRAFDTAWKATKDFTQAVDEGFKHIKGWFKSHGVPFDEAKLREDFKNHLKSVNEHPEKPPTKEPPKTEELVSEQDEIGFRHADTERMRQEAGIEEYERHPETREGWIEEAKQKIREGYNVENLLNKVKKGYLPDKVEQNIIGQYVLYLNDKLTNNPTDENLANLARVVEISDGIGGTEVARSLVSRKDSRLPDESLGNYFLQQRAASMTDVLTDKQKETNKAEFEKIDAANKEYQAKVAALEAENAKLKAQAELNKTKATSKKSTTKKTHDDYVKEREDLFSSIKDKWNKAGKDVLSSDIPFRKQFAAIAPDVARLMKSFVEEAVDKSKVTLEEVVKNIHGKLKDFIPEIQEKDVHDIIAGKYNERKKTKNELSEQLSNLKKEAVLLNKIDALQKGEEPKTEKAKVEKNKRLADLKKQLTDLRNEYKEANIFYGESDAGQRRIEKLEDELQRLKERREKEPTETKKKEVSEREKELKKQIEEERKTIREEEREANKFYGEEKDEDFKKLEGFIKRTESEIKKVEEAIRLGKYEPEAKTPLLQQKELKEKYPKLYNEALDAKDRLIKIKLDRELRLLKEKYANRSDFEKSTDVVLEVLNVPRAIMSSADFSAPLRQGIVATTAHPFIAKDAAKFMFQAAASQKVFDRWFFDVKEHPRYEMAQKSKLAITDPHDPILSAKEEMFMTNIAQKIPILGTRLIKGSERAYVGYLNKLRWDLFNRYAEAFEADGKTYDNSKRLYDALSNYINAATGRGSLGKFEESAKILNAAFFSPRLIASRVKLLTEFANPFWWHKTPKEVRAIYFKDMGKFIGVGLTTLALASFAGSLLYDDDDEDKPTIESDPRSSDWGKIKIGNTRYDIWGGFQQYIKVAAQLFLGERKTTTTGEIEKLTPKERLQTGATFVRGKFAPVLSTLTDVITGGTAIGERVQVGDELKRSLTPLITQDVTEAMKDKGVRAIFTVGIPSAFGVGTSTYGNTSNLEEMYDRNLTSSQTMDINKIKKYVNDKPVPITKQEYKTFTDLVDKYRKEGILDIYTNGIPYVKDEEADLLPFRLATPTQVQDEIKKIKTRATNRAKEELFPVPEDVQEQKNKDEQMLKKFNKERKEENE